MRLKSTLIASMVALVMCMQAGAKTPPVTGVEGVRLHGLAGTQTMVTVVLQYEVTASDGNTTMREARDSNLRVISVGRDRMTVLTEDGEELPYLFSMIKEVEVQDGKVERRALVLLKDVLSTSDQEIVNRAWARMGIVFGEEKAKQTRRMSAASLLAVKGDEEATKYLKQLMQSGDLGTEISAAFSLYLAGEDVDERLVREALESGNRSVRKSGCELAALYGYTQYISYIKTLLTDRHSEISAPAAKSLAYLGDREVLGHLYAVLGDSDAVQGEAAVWGLTKLGGADVIQQMELRAETAEGNELFRVARVLYALKKEAGLRLLRKVYAEYPTLKQDVAYILIADKDYDSEMYLRSRLSERMNETDANMVMRARIAGSLIRSGDPQAKAIYQEILRGKSKVAKEQIMEDIRAMGDKSLLNLIQSSIENVDLDLSSDASATAIVLGNSEYRERYLNLNDLRTLR